MSPQESIAHYRIVSQLGEGGMGAVYRATDTKLNRDVAIKVLLEAFRRDTSRMPKPLFKLNVTAMMNQYAASADGSRFLVSDVLTDDPRREVTVVLNWPSELKK